MNESEKVVVDLAIEDLTKVQKTITSYNDTLEKIKQNLKTLQVQSTPAPVPNIAWNSGAHTSGHSFSEATEFASKRGLPLGHYSVFPTRSQGPSGLSNTWWMPPKDMGSMISVALPMAYKEGSLDDDLSVPFTSIAKSLKSDGRTCIIRLGWEFNLSSSTWAWSVNDANLNQWRSRWSQYYQIFKSILGSQAKIGLNPNIGNQQSGISGNWVDRVYVEGKVDWVGPDAYDCWPPFTTEANIADQWNRPYGLVWWSDYAIKKNVPLAIPEWGVASGSQWAGHQGGDNPRYVEEMKKFLKFHQNRKGSVLFETYFHESSSYLKSDFRSNPNAGKKYKELFGAS